MRKSLILFLLAFTAMTSYAYDVCIDGICYNLVTKAKQAQIAYNGDGFYCGEIVVPDKITQEGEEYSVTAIDDNAFAYCSSLISIQIPNTITSIGNCAFWGCSSLVSIQIPNSVTSIGDNAFYNCSQLSEIEMPNNVFYIGNGAFSCCTNLQHISLPNKADIEWGNGIFSGCSFLTEIIIPKLVNNISPKIFWGMDNIQSYYVDSDNEYYCSIDGILYSHDKKQLVLFPLARNGEYVVAEDVESISDYAFCNSRNILSIILPQSLSKIGMYAFSNCSNLSSINIPLTVTCISEGTFQGCNSLNSIILHENIDSIGHYAFSNSGLFELTIPNSVLGIGDGAFCNCNNLYRINLPSKITEISNSLMSGCMQISNLIIPEGVTRIGDNAFSSCGMINITFPKSLEIIGSNVFGFCSLGDVVIPSVKKIKSSAFYYSMLTSIVLPEGLEEIEDEAFSVCLDLTKVTLPSTLKKIGSNCFMRCHSLSNINLPSGLESVGEYAISGTSIKELTIPSSLTIINDYAFSGNLNLRKLTIENGVEEIGQGAFVSNGLKKVSLPKSIKRIGGSAFSSGEELLTVVCKSEEAPVISSPFSYSDKSINVYVPEGCISNYNSSYWNVYNLIEGEPAPYITNIDDKILYYLNYQEEDYDQISYTRNFTNENWQALYVPFAMNYEDWADDFEVARLNDVHQFDDDEDGVVDRTVLELIKLKDGSRTEPNTPYMIKAKEAGEKTITLKDATLYATAENSFDVTSWYTKFTFTGTYSAVTDMATKGRYALADGALMQATSDAATLGAFRWYLDITDRNGNPSSVKARKVFLSFDDGETTEISVVDADAKTTNSIYSIGGMNMGKEKSALPKGLYIRNGKKFIVE